MQASHLQQVKRLVKQQEVKKIPNNTKVTLVGLTTKELNDKEGTIQGYNSTRERYIVNVNDSNKTVLIRKINLQINQQTTPNPVAPTVSSARLSVAPIFLVAFLAAVASSSSSSSAAAATATFVVAFVAATFIAVSKATFEKGATETKRAEAGAGAGAATAETKKQAPDLKPINTEPPMEMIGQIQNLTRDITEIDYLTNSFHTMLLNNNKTLLNNDKTVSILGEEHIGIHTGIETTKLSSTYDAFNNLVLPILKKIPTENIRFFIEEIDDNPENDPICAFAKEYNISRLSTLTNSSTKAIEVAIEKFGEENIKKLLTNDILSIVKLRPDIKLALEELNGKFLKHPFFDKGTFFDRYTYNGKPLFTLEWLTSFQNKPLTQPELIKLSELRKLRGKSTQELNDKNLQSLLMDPKSHHIFILCGKAHVVDYMRFVQKVTPLLEIPKSCEFKSEKRLTNPTVGQKVIINIPDKHRKKEEYSHLHGRIYTIQKISKDKSNNTKITVLIGTFPINWVRRL